MILLQHDEPQTNFTAIVTIGIGDVTLTRSRPAALEISKRLGLRLAYLDVFDVAPFALELNEMYFRIRESILPIDALERADLLGPNVLFLVNTPTDYHVHYVKQLLGTGCRIGVEKPLTKRRVESQSLIAFKDVVFPFSHQLFKKHMLAFIRGGYKAIPSSVRFELIETADVGNRRIDDAVFDLAWHGFEIIKAPFNSDCRQVFLTVTHAQLARYYRSQTGRAQVPTAARIDGEIRTSSQTVPFVIAVAKGSACGKKQLEYVDVHGQLHEISLDEATRWRPHYRVLCELLSPQPNLLLPLEDHASVVELCALARIIAVEQRDYPFGTLPTFFC